jgi:argininosuccinate lyase
VRGKTGRAIGNLMSLLTTLKGLPSGYNKDLQEDKHAVFDAEETAAGCLAVVGPVVCGLALNRQRAEEAASGLLLATDVADYLVARGVPFRRAHEIVGGLVRR